MPFCRQLLAMTPRRMVSSRGLAFVLGTVVFGFALNQAVAEPTRARPRHEVSAPAKVTLAGVNYTEARAVFSRLGFKPAWDAKSRQLTLNSGATKLVFTADSREASVLGLRTFLGEPAVLHKGALYLTSIDLERFVLPILRPDRNAPRPLRVIVIDAGHGGNDSGTRSADDKLLEKTFTLDVARRLQRLLAGSDWRVVMTRTDDRYIALPERAEMANAARADLFISIHFNAVANGNAVRGTETYVLTPRFQRSTSSAKAGPDDRVEHPGNRHDAWSAVLGYHMHRQLLSKLKTEDRGFKRARFAVLRLVNCPGVLVEAGYLSNAGEARRIAEPGYRGDIAEALASAVNAYAASLATAERAAAK
jgi:N-acetylmuramoyl-L-alanine amidase